MSKLIDAVKAIKTGKVSPMATLVCTEAWKPITNNMAQEYEFSAKFVCRVDLHDPETFPDALKGAFNSAKQMIAEEVFGEFRMPLLQLRQRAYASGDKESLEYVERILNSMFKV